MDNLRKVFHHQDERKPSPPVSILILMDNLRKEWQADQEAAMEEKFQSLF